MNQTAIVIGATGLVGRALTERLAAAGHLERIVTLTRRPAPHGEAKVLNQVVDFDRLEVSVKLTPSSAGRPALA